MAAALRPSPRPPVRPDLGSLGGNSAPASFLLGAAAATSAPGPPRPPGARRLGGFLGRRGPLLALRDLSPAGRQAPGGGARGRQAGRWGRGGRGEGGSLPRPPRARSLRQVLPGGPRGSRALPQTLSPAGPTPECQPPSPPHRPDCCAHSQAFRLSGSQVSEGLRMRFSQVPGDAAAAALGTTLGKPAGQAFQILSSPPAGSLLASCVSGEQSFIPRRRNILPSTSGSADQALGSFSIGGEKGTRGDLMVLCGPLAS